MSERKELVDSLSHEMKTPLGIIRAYAEGLQDEADEAKKQKYAQVIVSEVERMNDLIVTLLDAPARSRCTLRRCPGRILSIFWTDHFPEWVGPD